MHDQSLIIYVIDKHLRYRQFEIIFFDFCDLSIVFPAVNTERVVST